MEIRTGSLDFSAPVSGSGPRPAAATVVFPRAVATAVAGMSGYWMGYVPGDGDQHIGRLISELSTAVNDNTVTVTASLGVRDWSGDWDDRYQGTIDFALVAELESATGPQPRKDLIVTGIEHNQAVQFWRAHRYLDPVTVRPDNSIPLVHGKNTGLRVYVDYDASAGLPPISFLTGSLQVQTGSTVIDLQPINTSGVIRPGRDFQTDQTSAASTLNFMIPGAWCTGSVTVTCRVWDLFNTSPPSAAYTETLVFGNEAALNYYVVGINYTATPATPPPTLNDFIALHLNDVIRTYPMSDFPINGYQSIDYGETVTGPMPSRNCGHGMDDLLDMMSEMQGDSDDIYVALMGPGIMGTPGNQIGGCGTPTQVAIFLDRGMDLPHETGHALDRKHAPCTMNRCNPSPADPDPDYPQYGSLRSDSIGGFGFDPTTNQVFDPATTSDFMAYSGPNWVSAYTWSALAGAFALSPSSPGGHGIPGVRVPVLRFGATIHRDRTVERRLSFHYDGIQDTRACCGCGKGCCGGGPGFTAEISDTHGGVLVTTPLRGGCTAGCDDWPRTYRQKLVWPDGARLLKVWEGSDLLYEEKVTVAPKVSIRPPSTEEDGIALTWTVTHSGKKVRGEVWYLVQWYDDEDEAWRGVAPRQSESSIVIPWSLVRRSAHQFRVLASTGLATGRAEVDIGPANPPPTPGEGSKADGWQVLLAGHQADPDGAPVVHPASALTALGLDPRGKTVEASALSWYDDHGAQLTRGNTLDTRQLATGRHTVRAVVRDSDRGGAVSAPYLIEVGPGNPTIYATTPPRTPAADPQTPHKSD